MYRPIVSALFGALAVILTVWLGLGELLGAHPFWDVQVALVGAPIGALIAMLLGWLERSGAALLAGAAILIVGLVMAMRGKMAFASSYAEDLFSGALWYYGWITIFIGAALAIAALFSRASGLAGRPSAPPPLG
ncbi:hypothetical protein [Primorskyibacter flagellatus]|uniref:Uncharacterized protein n=1 Tax=Primorskyibacter flagellatus TaxID=1387277 RepID=A0A1W1ZWP1_9RHOB|nr:hypothetical protein [Primorskyibacter flagellatus]SMC52652.1 hypothetical protein SAMN06295998_102202 [Primorskyibacter flagellatus]